MTTTTTPGAAASAAAPAAAPQPGTPEYEAAMIAKFEQHTGEVASPNADQPQKPTTQKPEGVPEKFWNAEKGEVDYTAWSKSTSELEKRLTQTSQKPAEQPKPADDAAKKHAEAVKAHADKKAALDKAVVDVKAKQGATPEEIKAAEDAVKALGEPPVAPTAEAVLESKGLNMDEFSQEFAKDQKLSDASYAKLEQAGIPRQMVDTYIQGQIALVEKRDGEIVKAVGGDDMWKQLQQWGSSNMNQAEMDAFNKATASGTLEEAKLAVMGLKQRFETANGKSPQLLGGNNSNGNVGGYNSMEEYKADLRNPKYKSDEAFRNEVVRRVGITTAF